jgi:hypothetical protein
MIQPSGWRTLGAILESVAGAKWCMSWESRSRGRWRRPLAQYCSEMTYSRHLARGRVNTSRWRPMPPAARRRHRPKRWNRVHARIRPMECVALSPWGMTCAGDRDLAGPAGDLPSVRGWPDSASQRRQTATPSSLLVAVVSQSSNQARHAVARGVVSRPSLQGRPAAPCFFGRARRMGKSTSTDDLTRPFDDHIVHPPGGVNLVALNVLFSARSMPHQSVRRSANATHRSCGRHRWSQGA